MCALFGHRTMGASRAIPAHSLAFKEGEQTAGAIGPSLIGEVSGVFPPKPSLTRVRREWCHVSCRIALKARLHAGIARLAPRIVDSARTRPCAQSMPTV